MPKTLTIMTYNVHSSIGMDGKASPLRIAEVIDVLNPDVVAMQELDARLVRTDMIDQAHLIARTLQMYYHFHPSLQVEEGEGEYGNAILSRFPVRLVKAGPLPEEPVHASFERRGALWTEIEVEGSPLQIVTTHFGLNRRERLLQAQAITGEEWIGSTGCTPPLVLCGDFNAVPGSGAYRRLTKGLRDAQRELQWQMPFGTWPVRFPMLRIDHLFISEGLAVRAVKVPRTPLTRVASDHLPLLVTVELL
ncbi:endonuclease/exonuclease/phosphatase family protein [Geomonas sp. RF6]|uniref:endonuclease/exonuclease/phosphatase family protein n=1 Tax=Geomonas sp. RF6 TaxID=2897342 RepID=UPI001E56CD53|nr:endonuclease/exonuclease/phosphatase family protein [Geomonas sp. RF6]UFS69185.1 endonuclease/exonuclease/phosphatase family protein [Geomonas sp. RF6]